jgi:hypothetical protein
MLKNMTQCMACDSSKIGLLIGLQLFNSFGCTGENDLGASTRNMC